MLLFMMKKLICNNLKERHVKYQFHQIKLLLVAVYNLYASTCSQGSSVSIVSV
jgi:hypothetical protein